MNFHHAVSYSLALWVLITSYKIASTKPTYFENQSALHTTETCPDEDYSKTITVEDIKNTYL